MIPQQQQQMAGLMAGVGIAVLLVWVLAYAFFIYLFWRIFTKAGMSGPLALISLFPGLGWIICLCILAFGQWRVAAIPPGYDASTFPYPARDVAASPYPPTGPPTQL